MLASNPKIDSDISPQRSNGSSRVIVHRQGTSTRLKELFQEGCAKVRLPKTYNAKHLEAVMINTAGGMTGGDRMKWYFEAGQDTGLTVTTQACERMYQSSSGSAEINVSLKVQRKSSLCWLPQETILFNRCSARRKIQVDMEDDARVLMVEPLVFGREAMGETIDQGSFHDNWRVRQNGRLVHAEATRFKGDIKNLLKSNAVTDGYIAMATLLLLAPGSSPDLDGKLRRAQKCIASGIGIRGGVSLWQVGSTGKLLARVIGRNGYELRKTLIPLIGLLNEDADLPKSWAL